MEYGIWAIKRDDGKYLEKDKRFNKKGTGHKGSAYTNHLFFAKLYGDKSKAWEFIESRNLDCRPVEIKMEEVQP